MPSWMWSSTILHDAGAPLAHQAIAWQIPAHEPIEVVCLNDVALCNLVFHEEHIVERIDVDMVSPWPRIWDLAYLAYRLVPLGEYAGDTPRSTDAVVTDFSK